MIRRALGRKLRDDSGALVATLVFITVGFLAVGLMTAWMVSRVEADRSATVGAQLRSAAAEFAQQTVAAVNGQGTAALAVGEPTAFPELKASVAITAWNLNAAAETITVGLRARSTEVRGLAASSTLTLSSVDVGNYEGTSTTGRPIWAAAVAGTPPLSLWGIAPGALVTVGGAK